jgi:C-terminal peptidase (prc)
MGTNKVKSSRDISLIRNRITYFYKALEIKHSKMMRRAVFMYICCLFSVVTLSAQEEKDNKFEISKNLDIFNALIKEVEMFYVDTVDVERVVRRGINSMLNSLDPYTEYFPEQNTDNLTFMATGEYGGIGAYIRERENGGVIITEPFEGMPAALSGLKAGDLIMAIDTTDVSTFTSEKVSSLLKGVPNSKITLTIQRPGDNKPSKVNLVRKQILVNQVTYYGVRNDSIGYIHLQGFTDKSTQEVRSAFEDLKNNHDIKSLIIDLRNNGGGLLESAVQIVNMFVPKGQEIVSTRGKIKQWERTYRTSNDPIDLEIPLVVLINGGSASSAEILSGAIQDLDRGLLIGQRSFGKGLVQSTRELPYNGNLKITMGKYYIPSGRCIQKMDYSHRNADGSVSAVPDSLTSIFYTANGRPVRDGDGIRPDFEIEEPRTPTFMYYLMTDYVLFDFVTEWVQKHDKIAPVEEFVVTDEDYEAFKTYAAEKNFTYDRQSERALNTLKDVARFEGYLDGDSTILNALQEKLTPNLERDFDRFKDRIKKAMAAEIVKRYYYQRGEHIESLKDDNVLEKALEVLSDRELYYNTLNNPKD